MCNDFGLGGGDELADGREAPLAELIFLDREHTVRHSREMCRAPLFLNQYLPPETGDEKTILDRCDRMWRENVAGYKPPDISSEKLKALDDLLERAAAEFGAAAVPAAAQ